MPHLRFTRDKRGYENTYVVHAVRRRGKARQRILYWFRTPPNVRVGRGALDEGAIRALEEGNPEISFDWTKILEAQTPLAPAESADRRPRPRGGAGREPRAPRRGGRRGAALPPRGTAEAPKMARPAATPIPGPAQNPEPAAGAGLSLTEPFGPGPAEPPDAQAVEDAAEVADLAPASVPVTVYHGGADVLVTSTVAETPRVSPVEAHLGSEQLGRVRARYAEILARITERAGSDPVRLEELRRAADALNPDSWVTDAEIAAGLRRFDARLGEIRRALGLKRRRRSRRGGRRRHGRDTGPRAGAASSEVATSEAKSGDAAVSLDEAHEADGPAEDEPEDLPDPTD